MKNIKQQKVPNLPVENEDLQDLLIKFEDFHSDILCGTYGKTRQFYAIYINLINYYLLLERSVRMNDLQLFVYILAKIDSVFFAFNHPIYARWLLWYENSMRSLEHMYPGLQENILLGVKRTDKNYSRIPFDLTLEGTINADAARRLTGIMHLTNSILARHKWSISHALRSTIISHVLSDCGLTKIQYVTNDLQPHRIKISHKMRDDFTDALNNRMNPFTANLKKDSLFNICTGQAAPEEIATFLLSFEEVGESKRKAMIDACCKNEEACQGYVIKKTNILNFASVIKKKKVLASGKTQEVKLQRDLFGRLLGIALETEIDMSKVW